MEYGRSVLCSLQGEGRRTILVVSMAVIVAVLFISCSVNSSIVSHLGRKPVSGGSPAM